jgi:LPS-assembly lipoprotein
MTKFVALIFLSLALTACGFQLRGDIGLSEDLKVIAVESHKGNTPLAVSLKQSLQEVGVTVPKRKADAAYTLVLLEQSTTTRNATLDADARSAERYLKLETRFEIRDKAGKVVLGPETISSSRVYLNQVNNIAATDDERNLIRKELEQRQVQQIMHRIRALGTTGRPAPQQSENTSDEE